MPPFFRNSRAFAFDLPLFDDLEHVINVTPEHVAWDPRLGRREPSRKPTANSLVDLVPWMFLRQEVLESLADAQIVDEFHFLKSYTGWIAENPSTENKIEVFVQFDFDLLQVADQLSNVPPDFAPIPGRPSTPPRAPQAHLLGFQQGVPGRLVGVV